MCILFLSRPARSPRIRHRSELSENAWENTVQGLRTRQLSVNRFFALTGPNEIRGRVYCAGIRLSTGLSSGAAVTAGALIFRIRSNVLGIIVDNRDHVDP